MTNRTDQETLKLKFQVLQLTLGVREVCISHKKSYLEITGEYEKQNS